MKLSRLFVILAGLACFSFSIVRAATRYVSASGPGGDGLSWATASTNLAIALEAAAAGDSLWVAAGEYSGNLRIPSGVTVLAGFRGDETESDARNARRNATRVQLATNGAPTITFPPGFEPATFEGFRLVGKLVPGPIVVGTNATVRLFGLELIHPLLTEVFPSHPYGPSIILENCDIWIAGCSFINATAWARSLMEVSGSGLISRNRFISNQVHPTAFGTDEPTGIIAVKDGGPVIEFNWFANNLAAAGAGVSALGASDPLIRNNLFIAQQSYYPTAGQRAGGSALFAEAAAAPRFIHNSVTTFDGLPVLLLGTNAFLANNLFAFGAAGPGVVSMSPFQNNGWVGITNTYGSNSVPVVGAAGNIMLEPPFAGEPGLGQLQLRADSAAVDRGLVLSDGGDFDFFGNSRHHGQLPDLGAFESDGRAPVISETTVVHVRPGGDDSNSGLTWSTAKGTVSSALNEAVRLGGEVWVAAGLYPEKTLRFGYMVSLYGGFGGTETERNERDARLNPSILDGGGTNQILVQIGSAFTATGYRPLQTIDGFVFRNGFSSSAGGAISALSVKIQNSRFESNRVYGPLSRGSFGPFSGGGAVVTTGLSAILSGNTFVANSVVLTNIPGAGSFAQGSGGAVLIGGGDAVIRDNFFYGNWNEARSVIAAQASGSAIGVSTLTGLTNTYIENNTFIENFSIRTNSSQTTPPASILAMGTLSGGISGRAGIVLQNNLFAFNSGVIARDRFGTTNMVTAYNGVFQNTSDSIPAGVSNLFVNPGFGRPGVYPRLAADSPLRDAGSPLTLAEGRSDVEGRPRRIGGRVDIGAFEFDPDFVPAPIPVSRVSSNGDDSRDGSSWASAKRTIQAAADTLGRSGGEIWVRSGDYPGSVVLPEFVRLFGGFGGFETRLDERDWAMNPTVLGPSSPPQNLGEPLITMNSKGGGGALSGFRIRNGFGVYAGGVVLKGNGNISGNQFIGNRGWGSSAGTSSGGAIFVSGAGTTRVENNLFVSNSVTTSPLFVKGSSVLSAPGREGSVEFIHNTVFRNTVSNSQSLLVFGSTNHWVANNLFLTNSRSSSIDFAPRVAASSNIVWPREDSPFNDPWADPAGFTSVSPQLIDPAGGDFRPQALSPLRDAADQNHPPLSDRDLAGLLREGGGSNDIGAFEYYPPPPADFGVDITSPSGSAALIAGQPLDVNFSLTDFNRALINAVLLVNDRAVATNNGNVRTVRWAIPQIGTNSLVIRAEASGLQPALAPPVDVVFSVPAGDAPPVIRSVTTAPAASQLFAPVRFSLNAVATDGTSGVPARWEWRYAYGDLIRAGSNGVASTSIDISRAGNYEFTLRVWDRVGQTATTNFTVAVASPSRWIAELGGGFRPRAINDAGLVCGRLLIEGAWEYPAFLDEGRITPLLVGSRTTATINGLNAAGTAVGRFGIYPMRFRRTEAFRLFDGDGMAYGINAGEVIVGVLNTDGGIAVPTVWSNGVAASLPLNDACCGVARGINDAGWIAGYVTETNGVSHAALWRSGALELLPSDGAAGAAYAINNSGVIVGQVNGLPVRWQDGILEYLPIDGTEGSAVTVNADGAIGGSVNSRPVIWHNGVLREVTGGMSGTSRLRVGGGTVVSLNSGLDMVIDTGVEGILVRQRINVPAPRLILDPILLPVTLRIGAGLGFSDASLVIEASTDLLDWSPVATNALDFQIPIDTGFRFFRTVRIEP